MVLQLVKELFTNGFELLQMVSNGFELLQMVSNGVKYVPDLPAKKPVWCTLSPGTKAPVGGPLSRFCVSWRQSCDQLASA